MKLRLGVETMIRATTNRSRRTWSPVRTRACMMAALSLWMLCVPDLSNAQNFFQMTPEERKAYFERVNAASQKTWRELVSTLRITLPDSLPPMKDDPARPAGTFQKDGSGGWTDSSGNTYTRSEWGRWNNYDEAKAKPYKNLPDPLRTFDGRPVTDARTWWSVRRPELQEKFDGEIFGKVPASVPAVRWEVAAARDSVIGATPVKVKSLLGKVSGSGSTVSDVTIEATLVVPAKSSHPVPVILELGFVLPPGVVFPGMKEGGRSWMEQVLGRGWGYVIYVPTSVQADNGMGLNEGIIGIVNHGASRKPGDWGALRAWAWGASRVLDFLETESTVDAKRVAVEGLSRYGKATLVTMAYDTRFAIALVGSSGKGGATLYRREYGEAMGNIAGASEFHWFGGNFVRYADRPESLSVDAHELIAMCAPRPVFVSCGSPFVEGRWIDSPGQYLAATLATPVYALLGKEGLPAGPMPPIDGPVVGGDLAFRQHSGGHTVGPNWPFFLDFAAKYFAGR
jgi:hypothetical protein